MTTCRDLPRFSSESNANRVLKQQTVKAEVKLCQQCTKRVGHKIWHIIVEEKK